MKIFIFEDVKELTSNYHEDGALIIIAENLDRALQMARTHTDDYSWRPEADRHHIKLTAEEIEKVKVYELANDAEEKLFIFPNAGCC